MREIKLGVHRKAGAPGYGSDGVLFEVTDEIADDATPQQIADLAAHWYRLIETSVAAELARLQAMHAAPSTSAERPAPPFSQNGREDRFPVGAPPPRRRDPGDDDDQPPPPRERDHNDDRVPTTGRQLMGWSRDHGRDNELFGLAKKYNLGQVVTWDNETVAWAYGQLTGRAPTPTNGRNGNGRY